MFGRVSQILSVLVALLVMNQQIASANTILPPAVYEVPGGVHGYNAVGNDGSSIAFGTLNGTPGRMMNGNFIPFDKPAGWTRFVAGHPSADGRYGVFQASCGGVICTVVYDTQTGTSTRFTNTSLYQVGTAGDLAGQDAGGQPIRLSLSNQTPVSLPTGTDVGGLVAATSQTGLSVGTTFNADGTSSQPTVWASDGTRRIIAASTNQAGLTGVSNNGIWGIGFDGGIASLWNLLTDFQYLLRDSLGNFIAGSGLTVLNDGSNSGVGYVATSANGFVGIDPCLLLVGFNPIPACQPGGDGISRFTLSQNPNVAIYAGVGGQASIVAGVIPVERLTGQNPATAVPEISGGNMLTIGLLALGLLGLRRKKRVIAMM